MRPLLHIGYHKTGTTWLQKRVFPDEGAGFSFVGDPRAVLTAFFLVDPFNFEPEAARKRFRRKIGEAEERGLVPVLSHERLSGSPYAGDTTAGSSPTASRQPSRGHASWWGYGSRLTRSSPSTSSTSRGVGRRRWSSS